MASIRWRVWLFGNDLNTDVIHPPEFFSLDPEKVKRGLFSKLDASIQPRIQQGDVIVAGRNCGCGSSRVHTFPAAQWNRRRCGGRLRQNFFPQRYK
jgi:3-isopropylmalate dehydratase small subunit